MQVFKEAARTAGELSEQLAEQGLRKRDRLYYLIPVLLLLGVTTLVLFGLPEPRGGSSLEVWMGRGLTVGASAILALPLILPLTTPTASGSHLGKLLGSAYHLWKRSLSALLPVFLWLVVSMGSLAMSETLANYYSGSVARRPPFLLSATRVVEDFLLVGLGLASLLLLTVFARLWLEAETGYAVKGRLLSICAVSLPLLAAAGYWGPLEGLAIVEGHHLALGQLPVASPLSIFPELSGIGLILLVLSVTPLLGTLGGWLDRIISLTIPPLFLAGALRVVAERLMEASPTAYLYDGWIPQWLDILGSFFINAVVVVNPLSLLAIPSAPLEGQPANVNLLSPVYQTGSTFYARADATQIEVNLSILLISVQLVLIAALFLRAYRTYVLRPD